MDGIFSTFFNIRNELIWTRLTFYVILYVLKWDYPSNMPFILQLTAVLYENYWIHVKYWNDLDFPKFSWTYSSFCYT